MLEIVPETAERDQRPDRVARSDRRGTDKEIGGAGDAEQFGCWNCLGQGNNVTHTCEYCRKVDFFHDKENELQILVF